MSNLNELLSKFKPGDKVIFNKTQEIVEIESVQYDGIYIIKQQNENKLYVHENQLVKIHQ